MVMDDLQKIMFGVLEYHEDALVLKDNLNEPNNIGMAQLGAQRHLTDSRLRDTSILNLLALLVRLKLLDSELPDLSMATDSFVNSSISSTANEANDLILVNHADFTLVSDMSRASVSWIYDRISMVRNWLRTEI